MSDGSPQPAPGHGSGASLGTRSLADGELKTAVGLRDFLLGLGPLLQLPRRRKARPAAEEKGEARPAFSISPPLRRVMLAVLGLAATGAGAVHLIGASAAGGGRGASCAARPVGDREPEIRGSRHGVPGG